LTEDEIYSILNEIITDDSSHFHIYDLASHFKEPTIDHHVVNRFDYIELRFVNKQLDRFQNMSIKPNSIKRTGWRSLVKKNLSPFAEIKKIRSDTAFYYEYFSFPIISADRKKVIVTKGSDGAPFAAGSGTYLYINYNGHWHLKESWDLCYY
jgi:hypothetical protein